MVGEKSVKGYEFWLPYENFGATPAHNVRCEITAESHPMNEDVEVVQNDYPMGNRLIIGPGAGGSTGKIEVSVSDAMECWRRETEIVILVTFEYFDVFERDVARRTEYRVRLEPVIPPSLVIPEGSNVFNLIPFGANQST